MEKKSKNRDVKEILISIFPDIDRDALDEILNSPPSKMVSSTDLPLPTDDDIHNFDSTQTNFSSFSIGGGDKGKEDKYLRAVRKAVTTHHLPSVNNPNMNINKGFVIPTFLKKTFKSIASRLSSKSDALNKPNITSFSKKDTIHIVNVTGSQDTQYSYDLVTKRFANINNNHKFIFSYILPTLEEDKTNNYRNRKDIILTDYQNNMRNLDIDRFFFVTEEKDLKHFSHPVQQVEIICSKYQVQFMITGFNSLKGSKGDNKLLEKGLSIMLKSNKTPFIIVKESVFQKPESSLEGLNWLFVFDKINIKAFNAFKKFSLLVDFSRDKVTGYTMLPNSNPHDDIEPLFIKEFANKPNAKYEYEIQRYDSEPNVFVNNKVNFGLTRYDFVVIYNNNSINEFNKNYIDRHNMCNMHIILGASSNICVMNGN